MKKLPIILGLATVTAGAYTGAMISVDNANAQNLDNQPAEERPVETKKDINDLVINNIPNQVCTGLAVTPPIVILDAQKQLEEGIDFEVEYNNNLNAGTATATITFIGDYAELESINKTFEILTPQGEGGFLTNVTYARKSSGEITVSSTENLTVGLVVDFYSKTFATPIIEEGAIITSIDSENNVIYIDKQIRTTFMTLGQAGNLSIYIQGSYIQNSWVTEPSFTPGDYFNAQEFEMILDNYYDGGNGAGHLDLGEATYGDIIVEVKPQGSVDSNYVVLITKSLMEANNSDDDFGMIAWPEGTRPDEWLVDGQALTIRFRVEEGDNYFGLTKTIDIILPSEVSPDYSFVIDYYTSELSECYYDGNEKQPYVGVIIPSEDGMNDIVLTQGVDFEVSYSNNINVGTATITITFIGDYANIVYSATSIEAVYNNYQNDLADSATGPLTINFEILEADQS